MRKATLRVQNDADGGPDEWTYENAFIKDGPLEIESRVNDDGTIEIENMTVVVFSATFAGKPDVFELPARFPDGHERAGERVRYRAVVEENGEAILDGTIRKTGVSTDAPNDDGWREWSVEVEATALADVMDALKTTPVYAPGLLSAYDAARAVTTAETAWPGHQDTDGPELGSAPLRWYSLPGVWRALVDWFPAITYGTEDRVTLFPRPGDGAATQPHIISLASIFQNDEGEYVANHTLPLWTCKTLVDVLQGITGMRLGADYKPYPSLVVEINEIEGAWTEATRALPALDALATRDVYDVTTEEPNANDFALWYEGEGDDTPGCYAAYVEKPFQGDGESRKPSNEGTNEVSISLASFSETSEAANSEGREYTPRVGVPEITEEGAYLAAFNRADRVLAPTEPLAYRSKPGDPPTLRNEIWMREHLHRHPLTGATLHQATGQFDAEGLRLKAGHIEDGFSLEGRDWIIRSVRNNKNNDAAKIEGVRVTNAYDPTPAPARYFAAPGDLTAERTPVAPGEIWIRAFWRKPPATLTPRHYVFEVTDANGGTVVQYDLWDDRRGRPDGAGSYSFVRSDGTGLHFRSSSNGVYITDGTDAAPDWTIKMHARYETAGGWVSEVITAPFPALE